jgi:hypothetical protein
MVDLMLPAGVNRHDATGRAHEIELGNRSGEDLPSLVELRTFSQPDTV